MRTTGVLSFLFMDSVSAFCANAGFDATSPTQGFVSDIRSAKSPFLEIWGNMQTIATAKLTFL